MGAPAASDVGAVVLTGGTASRLQGADKASIEMGGATLLEHVLGALRGVEPVVVVGAEVGTSRPVTWRREDPPGGGPAAGVLAGLAGFPRPPEFVVVLAVDMPMVTTDTVHRLQEAARRDGAILVDEAGSRQLLCAIYRTASLLASAPPPEEQSGLAVHTLVAGLDLVEVPALAGEADDVDTWGDITVLRERLGD